jgi:hypothetical protein
MEILEQSEYKTKVFYNDDVYVREEVNKNNRYGAIWTKMIGESVSGYIEFDLVDFSADIYSRLETEFQIEIKRQQRELKLNRILK